MRDVYCSYLCPECGSTLRIHPESHGHSKADCSNQLCAFQAKWRYNDKIEAGSVPNGIPIGETFRISEAKRIFDERRNRLKTINQLEIILSNYQKKRAYCEGEKSIYSR